MTANQTGYRTPYGHRLPKRWCWIVDLGYTVLAHRSTATGEVAFDVVEFDWGLTVIIDSPDEFLRRHWPRPGYPTLPDALRAYARSLRERARQAHLVDAEWADRLNRDAAALIVRDDGP